MTKQRVILDAALDRSVIPGTVIAATGERREFHGWLELNTALEAILDPPAERAPIRDVYDLTSAEHRKRRSINSDV